MPHACGVCLEEYDSHTKIPKNLECGHSLCRPCLVVLLRSLRSCPHCRVSLTKENIEDYQTVFQLIGTFQINEHTKDPSGRCFKNIKRKIQDATSSYDRELKSVKSDLRVHETKLMVANQRLHELQQSKAKFEGAQNFLQKEIEFMNQSLRRLEEGNLVEPLVADQTQGLLENLFLNGSRDHFKLGDFASPERYLQKVHEKTEQGKPVFAYHRRQNGIFYGKVSYQDWNIYGNKFPYGLIRVASMTVSDVEDNVVLTPFEDLKDIARNHFIAFLKFRIKGWENVWFFPLNASPLARQFLTLCTGEEGPIYKGSLLKKTRKIWSVAHYQLNGDSTSGRLSSTASLPSEKFQNSSSWVLEGFLDGSFNIKGNHNYKGFSSKNVISHGIHRHLFLSRPHPTVPDFTILECGFVLKCSKKNFINAYNYRFCN